MEVVDVRSHVDAGARQIELRIEAPLDPGTGGGARIDAFLSWYDPASDSVLELAAPPRLLAD